jgi:hypothetical protein
MKVLSLKINGFRGIEAAELTPDGKSVTVSGRNGAGKSSVLDAIVFALTGQAAPPVVHAGAEKAEVEVDVGEYVVRRTASAAGKERLVVTTRDGSIKGTPQTFLNSLVRDGLAFDPLRFEAMKPAEQVAALMKGLGIDVVEKDRERAQLYLDRTETGRQKKAADGAVATLATPEVIGAPDAFDTAELRERVDRLRTDLGRRSRLSHDLGMVSARVKGMRAELASLEAEELRLTELMQYTDDPTATLAAAEGELSDAGKIATLVERKKQLAAKRKEAAELDAAYQDATAAIDQIDEEKRAAIAGANLGIDGLDVMDDGIVLSGLPLRSVNRARRVRVGLRIAARLTPGLRIVLVDEGSALDSESMADLVAAAHELGLQLWVARVQDGAGLAFEVWEEAA